MGGFSKGGLSSRGERGGLVGEGFFAHEGIGAAEIIIIVLNCRHCNPKEEEEIMEMVFFSTFFFMDRQCRGFVELMARTWKRNVRTINQRICVFMKPQVEICGNSKV